LELERIKREEEDRLRREAEAKRRKEELERLVHEVSVNRDAEENRCRLLEITEQQRMAQEEVIYGIKACWFYILLADDVRFRAQWFKYLECDPRPDASLERELNTYINTWRELSTHILEDALNSCNFTEQVLVPKLVG
jgi:cancer susceptibility candidate protein 1